MRTAAADERTDRVPRSDVAGRRVSISPQREIPTDNSDDGWRERILSEALECLSICRDHPTHALPTTSPSTTAPDRLADESYDHTTPCSRSRHCNLRQARRRAVTVLGKVETAPFLSMISHPKSYPRRSTWMPREPAKGPVADMYNGKKPRAPSVITTPRCTGLGRFSTLAGYARQRARTLNRVVRCDGARGCDTDGCMCYSAARRKTNPRRRV